MVANMQPPRLPVSETDRRRRYQTKRWNPDGTTQDLTHDQRIKKQNRTPPIADRGWKSRKSFSTSGRGRKMFLTSPLIDQAFTLKTTAQGSMSSMAVFRQIPRLEQLATKRVLLGTNLGHSALIHTPPPPSSSVMLWRQSARGACPFLLSGLGCLP